MVRGNMKVLLLLQTRAWGAHNHHGSKVKPHLLLPLGLNKDLEVVLLPGIRGRLVWLLPLGPNSSNPPLCSQWLTRKSPLPHPLPLERNILRTGISIRREVVGGMKTKTKNSQEIHFRIHILMDVRMVLQDLEVSSPLHL